MNLDKKQYSLILSKDFQALDAVGVKKSMKYLCTDVGKAMDPETYQLYNFEEWIDTFCKTEDGETVRTEKLWIKIPEIIVLHRNYVRKKSNGPRALSKRKVYERDGHQCGYCGVSLNSKNRTIDHIHPTSKGGSKYDYGNVVASCGECNSVKSDRLLEDLIKNGPHKKDEFGNIVCHREKRWKLVGDFSMPKEDNSVLKHIPKSKWLPSWEPYIKVA